MAQVSTLCLQSILEDFPDIATKILQQDTGDHTLAMLRNLYDASKTLRRNLTVDQTRLAISQAYSDFGEMTACIDDMLTEHLDTETLEMTVVDQFMLQGSGQNFSRLYVVKRVFDLEQSDKRLLPREKMMLRREKRMRTAEHVLDTFVARDFELLIRDMENMAACADILEKLFLSVFYVFGSVEHKFFCTCVTQDFTCEQTVCARRDTISDAVASAGVFVCMLETCAKHPRNLVLLDHFFLVVRGSGAAKTQIFDTHKHTVMLQSVTSKATVGSVQSALVQSVHLQYARLMRDLFVMRDTSTCIASQSEESVIVVAMVEMMLVISQTQEERYHDNDAASILLKIISQEPDDRTLLTLYALGLIDQVLTSRLRNSEFCSTLVRRGTMALRQEASMCARRDTISDVCTTGFRMRAIDVCAQPAAKDG